MPVVVYLANRSSYDQEIAKLRREKAELEGKTSPSATTRPPPPSIGLGTGLLFPQLTPGVREGKPVPGSQSHDPYINGGVYSDAQNSKRPRPEDPYPRGTFATTLTPSLLVCANNDVQLHIPQVVMVDNLRSGLKLVPRDRQINHPSQNQFNPLSPA